MTYRRNLYSHVPSRQRGMTLLVGLILLVMLTAISVVGFRNTTMSERMTGNSVDRNVSFQSAESAGKEALTSIEAGSFSPGTVVGHFATPLAQGGTTTFWTQGDGAVVSSPSTGCATTTPFSWSSCAVEVANKYEHNASKAKYVIELLTSVSTGGSTVSTYRITSRSTGGSGNADVILQTNYVRTTTP
jgi:type IV pilus assembly protein PilX